MTVVIEVVVEGEYLRVGCGCLTRFCESGNLGMKGIMPYVGRERGKGRSETRSGKKPSGNSGRQAMSFEYSIEYVVDNSGRQQKRH